PAETHYIIGHLIDSDDQDIVDEAFEALSMAEAILEAEDDSEADDEFDDDGEFDENNDDIILH
ncbi:MAG: hypothetical protein HF978_20960, partial [Desulfobacteraceae bacterium]|nr:hypothetical protein [Desulfobacteraceae bacterium]MBC2758020.1 hypothetical protein [Desulfobacteraceae bacterium]